MTLPALSVSVPGTLAVTLPEFRLERGEPLVNGLQRLGLDQLERAASGFYDGEEVFGLAVHEARKAMKRIRALLRLVRFEIGEKAYRFENSAMRDIGRLLSEVRSAAVMAYGVEAIREMYGPFLAPDTFGELAERLAIRHDRTEQRVMEDPGIISGVVAKLERAHGRYSSWPTDPQAREVYGFGIRDSFEAIGPGLQQTYGRGRRGMVAAYQRPSPVSFHLWRKSVKYLKYQLELLTPLWPEVLLGMALTLERIGGLLGEDHDLAELLRLVARSPDLCPNPVERSLLKALASQRRFDLQTASRILGRRIYTETPASLNDRFEAFWHSTHVTSEAFAALQTQPAQGYTLGP